jgi:hypothetical protein
MGTLVRVCRRHKAVCDDPTDHLSSKVVCPRGHVVPEGRFDVVRLEDGHVVIGGKGMSTRATRRFTDDAGNGLVLQVTTGKRAPYLVRGKHSETEGKSRGAGPLARAGDEQTARKKLDELAEQALERGWHEQLGREGLTEIPDPVVASARSGGGGLKGSRPDQGGEREALRAA